MTNTLSIPTQKAKTPPLMPKEQTLSPLIIKLFQKRNFSDEDIREFFSWNLKNIPSLEKLLDLDKSAKRLLLAISQKEKIGVFGDYDVDGTTSCALLYHFFQMFDTSIELIQPGRFLEGYGIHPPSIERAKEKGIQVLITVDCGITNNEAALKARELGIDLIITDHHKDARETMPEAFAVVNPNRRDEDLSSDLCSLAGVSVAFALCLKIKKIWELQGHTLPSIYPLLQFVAIGTICDLAYLNPLNLKLVRHGLKQILNTKFCGLRSFFIQEELDRKLIPSEKLSFQIGPLINSKGRLDHPEKALKLLISSDENESLELHSQLEICNNERKFIQNEVFTQARDQVLQEIDHKNEHLISIVYHSDWHEGVIGIVASKLVEEFKVPAVIFTNSEEKGILKASARTAGELDLFQSLHNEKDLFLKFGGHKAAAGLSMIKENYPLFVKRMNQSLASVPHILRTRQENYDLELRPQDITLDLIRSLEQLEPFGQGNPKPRFKMKNFKIDSYSILKEKHVRWSLSGQSQTAFPIKLRGISFNYIGKWMIQTPEHLFKNQNLYDVDLCAYFTLSINHFRGNQFIQLMIDKMTMDDI